MSDNRSQDVKLIKLAIKVEKDALQFFSAFLGKIGEGKLSPFLQQINTEISEDLARFEEVLKPLETGYGGNIEELSLDQYTRENTRGEKFFPSSRISELIEGQFNPIQALGASARIMNDLSGFYRESATNIFYETEKNVFLEIADRKKEQSESISRKRKETIARFP